MFGLAEKGEKWSKKGAGRIRSMPPASSEGAPSSPIQIKMGTDVELQKKIRLYRFLTFFFAAVALGLSISYIVEYTQRESPLRPKLVIQEDAPNSELIRNIIRPLRYSGLPDLLRPEVSLAMDFPNKTWTLHELHRFDAQGNIILNEGKYGVCGDLAAYVYQKIKPYFPGDRYNIEFIQAAESSYFQGEAGGVHIIMRIIDLAAGKTGDRYNKVYVLDPSLRRYGNPEYFADYRAIDNFAMLEFLKSQRRYQTFRLNKGTPVIINRKAIVSLYVVHEDGKFDPDNFGIMLSATPRYQFAGKMLFGIHKKDGKVTYEEKDYPIASVMKVNDYRNLKKRLINLYERMGKELSKAGRVS